MRNRKYILIGALLISLISCEQKWEEHYGNEPETVNMNIWDAVKQNQDLSEFVSFMEEFRYDTLFLTDNGYTLFIPDNDAFAAFLDTGVVSSQVLDYHISMHYIQSRNIDGRKKIQTLAEKFAFFENAGSTLYFDDIDIDTESPLYLNGKFYIIGQVALPKPNLYEFFSIENPVLTAYIDSYDSIILDKELSRPIGFDSLGNTVYDTVAERYNEFEEEYFPVSEESRSKTATFVFPLEEDYNGALDEMAEALGELYQDHSDIPVKWQYEVLIPYIVDHGVFENMLEPDVFIPPPLPDTLKLKNILGDSIYIEYMPKDKALCSNGYAYNYTDFSVPDTLFTSAQRLEGEHLLEQLSASKFAWLEEVTEEGDRTFEPFREFVADASNDSIVRVPFNLNYDKSWSLKFRLETLFPRKYLVVVRTHMYIGGIYDIRINDEPVMTMDWYDYVLNWNVWWSVTGPPILAEGSFNYFDCFFENNAPYGECTMEFVYREPGQVKSHGLVIDYIDFIPYDF